MTNGILHTFAQFDLLMMMTPSWNLPTSILIINGRLDLLPRYIETESVAELIRMYQELIKEK